MPPIARGKTIAGPTQSRTPLTFILHLNYSTCHITVDDWTVTAVKKSKKLVKIWKKKCTKYRQYFRIIKSTWLEKTFEIIKLNHYPRKLHSY